MSVRVRFAPSPTGPLHIGGVRTALFNYLFAKKHNGTFFLRIEDTDQNRFVEGAEQYIFEALEWLGISPNETVGKNEKFGPYRQSERKEIYKQYAEKLIAKGWAYYAFDTPDALDKHRKEAEQKGDSFMYGPKNRTLLDNSLQLNEDEVNQKIASGVPYVIRFKIPENEELHLKDIIRGDLQFHTQLLDDKILFKSDGMPTYHLANVVDDYLMQTTHVIRGEEWLPSLPLHTLLYRAFAWNAPKFAHLPLILKPYGNGKLSKRDGDQYGFPVFPLEWKSGENTSSGYRESGYFPEAVVNFLALLGWNDGTEQELFSLEELCQKFDLERVHKAGAKFDPEKNKWFNGQYLQSKAVHDILPIYVNALQKLQITTDFDNQKLEKIIDLHKERTQFVSELAEMTTYLFVSPENYEEKGIKNWNEQTSIWVKQCSDFLKTQTTFVSSEIEQNLKAYLTEQSIPVGKVMPSLRLSVVGAMKGPHLFDIFEILGQTECIKRLENACHYVANVKN
jgi:glutamyl-tRNA synthetase